EPPEVAAGDRLEQVLGGHPGEDHPRQPRADAVDPDQLLEQRLLALGPEAEERDAVLAHVGMDEQADRRLAPLLDLVPGGERDVDLVTDALPVEEQALRVGPEEGALKIADHGPDCRTDVGAALCGRPGLRERAATYGRPHITPRRAGT